MTESNRFAVAASAFIGIWLIALALPFFAWRYLGLGVASLVGLLVPAFWIAKMPCTCMDGGGLGGSVLAIIQFFAGVGWAVVGIALLIRAIF